MQNEMWFALLHTAAQIAQARLFERASRRFIPPLSLPFLLEFNSTSLYFCPPSTCNLPTWHQVAWTADNPVIRVVLARDNVARCMRHVCDIYVSCPASSSVNCFSRLDRVSCVIAHVRSFGRFFAPQLGDGLWLCILKRNNLHLLRVFRLCLVYS